MPLAAISPLDDAPATPESAEALIRVDGVSVVMGGRGRRQVVLDAVDLTVERGAFVCLIGPSGCGKSTLLKVLAGLVTPTSGAVTIGGLPPAEAARRRQIGLVFQDANLLPWKSALDNAALLLGISDRSLSRAALRARAGAMLQLVGLGDAGHKRPSELSGGMRQRVSIARALALDPEVLLMDEPFGALDAITREVMSRSLLDIWRRTGKTIVLVTHAIEEAVALSGEVHVLGADPGRIVESLAVALPYPRGEEADRPEFIRLERRLRQALHLGHGPEGDP